MKVSSMSYSRKLKRKGTSYPVLRNKPKFVFPTYTEADLLEAVENTKKITSLETVSMTLAVSLYILENNFSMIMRKKNRLDNFVNLYLKKASEFNRSEYRDFEKMLEEKYDLKVIYETQ